MILSKVKTALRIKSNSSDEEVTDLIEAAVKDLKSTGIKFEDFGASDPTDPLITQAVILYCKANSGTMELDHAEKARKAYESLKIKLSCVGEYKNVD